MPVIASVILARKLAKQRAKKKADRKAEEAHKNSPAYKKKVTGAKDLVLRGEPGKLKPIGSYKGKKAKLTPLKKKKK